MKNTIIEMAMQSLETAYINAETALRAVLQPYGNIGLELNVYPNTQYSVNGEVVPNVFKKIVKVRSHSEGLQMLTEGESEWVALDCTDYKFLLEEVQNAIGE